MDEVVKPDAVDEWDERQLQRLLQNRPQFLSINDFNQKEKEAEGADQDKGGYHRPRRFFEEVNTHGTDYATDYETYAEDCPSGRFDETSKLVEEDGCVAVGGITDRATSDSRKPASTLAGVVAKVPLVANLDANEATVSPGFTSLAKILTTRTSFQGASIGTQYPCDQYSRSLMFLIRLIIYL